MKDKKQDLEEVEEYNKYVMARMHPAVLIPGMFIGVMVIVGCIFKGIMGW
tara:strand:+ start:66 stop:215 length:150 start_codon:yes stop_codon:yes gene_type:complete